MTDQIQKTENMTSVQYNMLELEIKKEQAVDKKELSTNFNVELKEWLELAYMLPKDKKENFITREKLTSMMLKLIRSEKKFKNPKNIFDEIRYLAVFDKENSDIGKLMNIDISNKTAEYLTYFDKMNGYDSKSKHWRDIYLFDYNSPQLEVMYREYAGKNQRGLSFTEMTHYLEQTDYIKQQDGFKKGYGVELVEATKHPVMKKVMIEYKIPAEIIKKPKRILQQLHPITLEVVMEFESVTMAEKQTGISDSTISNVLCQGYSARKYDTAGSFKWRYSTEINSKYAIMKAVGKANYSKLTKDEWNDMIRSLQNNV